MEQEKYIFLQNLYKCLRKLDVETLTHFCDNQISNDEYFLLGVKSDIYSNILNILTNYLSGNIESAGVDLSCRAIIEALTILKMFENGDISLKQMEIYRNLYAYVDVDNFHSLLTEEDKLNPRVLKVLEDKEKCEKAITEHFNCSRSDLKKRDIGLDDPCFYLKRNLDDDIRFSKLLSKYPLKDEKDIKMYEFFSLFIHPRCEMNPQIEEAVMSVRNIYIDNVLEIVYEYLMDQKLFEYYPNDKDFNQEFFENDLLRNNVQNVKDVECLFNNLIQQICKLKDENDMFSWHLLEKTKYIIIDLMISESLGYKEHVISSFKTFVEEYGVFFAIGSMEQRDFDYAKKTFWCSSRMQLDAHFQDMGWKDATVPENEIKALYDEYYNEKYNLNNYQKFYWGLRRNSLYFLDKDKKSYNKPVRTMIESIFTDERESKDVMTLYRISKDMCHASGYNFNASEGIVDCYFRKTMIYTWKLIIHFILNASLTLKEHNEECDVSFVIKCFEMFANVEAMELKKVYESYVPESDA